MTRLLRRTTWLADGLALKEPAPPPFPSQVRRVSPNEWFPRSPSPPCLHRGREIRHYRLSSAAAYKLRRRFAKTCSRTGGKTHMTRSYEWDGVGGGAGSGAAARVPSAADISAGGVKFGLCPNKPPEPAVSIPGPATPTLPSRRRTGCAARARRMRLGPLDDSLRLVDRLAVVCHQHGDCRAAGEPLDLLAAIGLLLEQLWPDAEAVDLDHLGVVAGVAERGVGVVARMAAGSRRPERAPADVELHPGSLTPGARLGAWSSPARRSC